MLFKFATESTYRHHVELDGQFLSLDVLDTAGKVQQAVFTLNIIVN